ncbi:hypothetical protein OIU76_014884 [Salix suchowensis]|nr:hypothetical protein OIU76_014884 [Salix suchowensis]KAJ6345373.1 hypothetical protein OIU78_008108 [Salix suchowensis]
MAPTGRKRASAETRRRRRTERKTQYKKTAVIKPKSIKEATKIEDFPSNSSTGCNGCSKIDSGLDFESVDISTSACSTPKAERFPDTGDSNMPTSAEEAEDGIGLLFAKETNRFLCSSRFRALLLLFTSSLKCLFISYDQDHLNNFKR